jgi:two-component system OmpR family response regulator
LSHVDVGADPCVGPTEDWLRVLVVEDETLLSHQLASALGDAGYAVDCAVDGERADFLGQTEQYDAVILDLGLPSFDGLTVLRRWRDAGIAVPVLVLTARGSWHEGARDRRRRRRLRRKAIQDRGGARAAARADPARERTGHTGPAMRRRRPGSAGGEGDGQRSASEADGPRVSCAGVPDAPARARSLAGGAHGTHLRPKRDRDSNTVEVFIARLRRKLGGSYIETVRGLGYRVEAEP